MNGDREEQPGRGERFGWGEGDIVILKDDADAKTKLATIARALARQKKDELDRHKAEHDQIERPIFCGIISCKVSPLWVEQQVGMA